MLLLLIRRGGGELQRVEFAAHAAAQRFVDALVLATRGSPGESSAPPRARHNGRRRREGR
jgi:hypothetical protein